MARLSMYILNHNDYLCTFFLDKICGTSLKEKFRFIEEEDDLNVYTCSQVVTGKPIRPFVLF
jgi:hypothetical protein